MISSCMNERRWIRPRDKCNRRVSKPLALGTGASQTYRLFRNPDSLKVSYKAPTRWSTKPTPFPRAPPPLKSLPIMSTNLYEILGVQRDVTDEQSTSNPFPSVVHPPLILPQSERLTRNGRYKLTLIVSLRSKNQPRKMSSERSSIPSIHSLLCHSLTTPGEQRI